MNLLKKITKLLVCFSIMFIFLTFVKPTKVEAKASGYISKTQEYRACWVSVYTGDIPSYQNEAQYKAAFNTILDNMEAWGMNAMVYHVRIHNDALYNSDTCPIRSAWSSVNFDEFDPLTWSIEAAHARGIEFHAWLNPYRVSSQGVSSDTELQNITKKFPAANPASDASNLLATSGGVILDPGLPNVRQFIVDTCMDIVNKYDVDAIHFDDYFYISGCDDTKTRTKYNTNNLSTADFRRQQVDLLIEAIHNALKEYNTEHQKAVQLGIAPSSVYRNGSYGDSMTPTYDSNGTLTNPLYSNTSGFAHYGDYLYCDTKKWVDNEWIDYITPQTYHAIGHSSSSFAKLDKWWDWVVKYKKVNLYMGVGLYMQVDADTATSGSASYWKDPNEMENQILDANKYQGVGGMCIYKYGTLLSNKSLINTARNAIKSYWDKKVPCPVLPQHTELSEPYVTGLSLNDKILSWNACDNVRGYVVWQVPTNNDVDTEDYTQLYRYTTSTSVEIVNGYDYYVSSVNYANEFSEPASMNPEGDVDRLISSINNLTFPMTLDKESKVNELVYKYNLLSDESKALVTNYESLQNAVSQITTLKAMASDATTFVNSLKTDVLDTYLLPLTYKDYTVTWNYVNSSDSSLYNKETGKVLVEYLATTLVPLKLTLTKNGLSYEKEFKLNVGYVKQSEIGLFYRNTPNALNKEEDKEAQASFIGWSGVVLKFKYNNDTYIFFQADLNYHELTSTDIPSCPYSSCGCLYVNNSSKTITKTAQEFNLNTSSNYGYFIVGTNGLVRESVATVSESATISLAPGEFIYGVKYLDGLIDASVMKPASNLAVGTRVELIKPVWTDEANDQSLANAIIDEISAISFPVTINQKDLIERTESLYNNASSSVKALVTNHASLVQALSDLAEILEEYQAILNARQTAKQTISAYIPDKSIYSSIGKAMIDSVISMFNSIVETKDDVNQINSLVTEYEAKLDNILTAVEEDAELIEEARSNAISELKSYVTDLSKYSTTGETKIKSIISEYETKINNEDLVNNVNAMLEEAYLKIDAVPTYIEEVRKTGIAEIEKYYAEIVLTDYSSTNQSKIRSKVYSAKTKVNAATTINEVNQIIAELKDYVDELLTIEEELALLNSQKEAAIKILEDKLNGAYTSYDLEEITVIVNTYVEKINNAKTYDEILSYKASALSEIGEYHEDSAIALRKEALEEANEYISKIEVNEVGNSQLESLLVSFEKDLKKARNETSINELLEKFKEDADAIKKAYPVKQPEEEKPKTTVNCLGAINLVPFISLLGIAVLTLFKRKN